VSSEAADVVLTVDRLDRLGEALVIARRTRGIAVQSVVAGIALSTAAMVVAALGYLPPGWGAVLQEVIDAAVIANALRARRDTSAASRLTAGEAALTRRFSGEHATLRPALARIRAAADALDPARPVESCAEARAVHRFLVEEIAPHEEAEDASLYPALARVLGGSDPTATMSRAHVEIAHLIRRVGRVLDDLDPDGPQPDDIVELRRLLYGLHAVLELHFAQEDESYLSLADEIEPANPPAGRPILTRAAHGSTTAAAVATSGHPARS
jgi:hemerythrin HHE cation binding domain-containing protein